MTTTRVFYDGTLTTPRLDHPECVAIHPDGSVWCGGEAGQIYRIDPDGTSLEQVASTGGFILGIAFDATASALYACDIAARAVFRVPLDSLVPEVFADGADGHRFRNPNYAVFDDAGRLYVSDSYPVDEPGPPVFRFAPDGPGEIWFAKPMGFANGLALDSSALYVAESFLPGVSRIEIEPDGSAGRSPATRPRTCCATRPTSRSVAGPRWSRTWAAGTSRPSRGSEPSARASFRRRRSRGCLTYRERRRPSRRRR